MTHDQHVARLEPMEGPNQCLLKHDPLQAVERPQSMELPNDCSTMVYDTDPGWAGHAYTQLTERFFRRSVLYEASCLHYLLPDNRDSSVTDHLHHAKTSKLFPAITISLGPILR